MSIDSFKPSLWEASLLTQFTDVAIVTELTTPPSETNGDKIIWNALTASQWKDYIKGSRINWEQLSTTPIEMPFDRQQSFAVMVDNVDKCQAGQNGDSLEPTIMQNQANILAENIDIEVINYIIANTSAENTLGTEAPIKLTPSNIYDTIVDLGVILSKKKVPLSDRCVIINNSMLAMLAKDERFTRNYQVLTNGIVQGSTINGAKVCVKEGFTDGKILLNHKSSTGYAMQLNQVEAVKLTEFYADGVRGLTSYAKKQLRPESSAVANVTI
ncbi:hypothetical protein ACED96_15485 [Clostridium thermobutyricum]